MTRRFYPAPDEARAPGVTQEQIDEWERRGCDAYHRREAERVEGEVR